MRKPLYIFLAVEKALFLRELNKQISVGKAGLFWTFFEPFMQVTMFILIRAQIMGRTSANYDVYVFMASGFIAFNMFRKIFGGASNIFISNKGLYTYKQVKPVDTLIAKALETMFITSIIILLFLCIGFFLQYDNMKPENLLMVVAGYLWLALFAFGLGLIVAVGNTFFVSIGKVVAVTSFGLMIISAVFFPIISVPPEYQEYFLYNPLVHFMEMIHGAYLYDLDDRFVDYRYMALWTLISLFVGLWLYIKQEKKIISI